MEAELYLDYNTIIHRLDPRTKILLFLFAFFTIIFIDHPLWMLPLSGLIFFQAVISRSLTNLRRIRHVLFIITTMTLVLWSLFVKGETKLFWIYSLESIAFSVSRGLLILSLITTGMILISTTRNEEIVVGMIRLGLPYRVGFALSTSLRLVPTIVANAFTIIQAQRSRGLDLESGNLIQRIRKYIPLLIPVFISTIRNTNIFGMALEAKGFGARPERTYYLQLRFRVVDYICMALMALIFTFYTYVRIAGFTDLPGLIRF